MTRSHLTSRDHWSTAGIQHSDVRASGATCCVVTVNCEFVCVRATSDFVVPSECTIRHQALIITTRIFCLNSFTWPTSHFAIYCVAPKLTLLEDWLLRENVETLNSKSLITCWHFGETSRNAKDCSLKRKTNKWSCFFFLHHLSPPDRTPPAMVLTLLASWLLSHSFLRIGGRPPLYLTC